MTKLHPRPTERRTVVVHVKGSSSAASARMRRCRAAGPGSSGCPAVPRRRRTRTDANAQGASGTIWHSLSGADRENTNSAAHDDRANRRSESALGAPRARAGTRLRPRRPPTALERGPEMEHDQGVAGEPGFGGPQNRDGLAGPAVIASGAGPRPPARAAGPVAGARPRRTTRARPRFHQAPAYAFAGPRPPGAPASGRAPPLSATCATAGGQNPPTPPQEVKRRRLRS